MKVLALLLLLPSLSLACDRSVDTKKEALRKCGPPDSVSNLGSFGPQYAEKTKELWSYRNKDGSVTTLRFRGNTVMEVSRRPR